MERRGLIGFQRTGAPVRFEPRSQWSVPYQSNETLTQHNGSLKCWAKTRQNVTKKHRPRCFGTIFVKPWVLGKTRCVLARQESWGEGSHDVTAQRLSENALRDAMLFKKAIIQDAGESIAVYERELRYKVFNPYMERLTGTW